MNTTKPSDAAMRAAEQLHAEAAQVIDRELSPERTALIAVARAASKVSALLEDGYLDQAERQRKVLDEALSALPKGIL